MVRDLIAAADETTAALEEVEAVSDVEEELVASESEPEPEPEPELEAAEAEVEPEPEPEADVEPEAEAEVLPELEAAESEPEVKAEPEPEPELVAASEPLPAVDESVDVVEETVPEPVLHEPVASAPSVVSALPDADASRRRSNLRRRAAGLSALSEEPSAPTATTHVLLEELDALEDAAELAVELERALSEAADANERLRKDLGSALDDLARSTAEGKRYSERVEKLETEARDRSRVVQDLVSELELLEGERDAALGQSSNAALEIDEVGERLMLTERRVAELERALGDAQARTRRFEEAAQTHAVQRAALRAEVESLRRERDSLLTRTAELEREGEDLGRSRKALDEVHRALTEARIRAQRIRTR